MNNDCFSIIKVVTKQTPSVRSLYSQVNICCNLNYERNLVQTIWPEGQIHIRNLTALYVMAGQWNALTARHKSSTAIFISSEQPPVVMVNNLSVHKFNGTWTLLSKRRWWCLQSGHGQSAEFVRHTISAHYARRHLGNRFFPIKDSRCIQNGIIPMHYPDQPLKRHIISHFRADRLEISRKKKSE